MKRASAGSLVRLLVAQLAFGALAVVAAVAADEPAVALIAGFTLVAIGALLTGPRMRALLNAARERASDEVRRLEERNTIERARAETFGLILNSMREGVLLASPDGTVRFANPAVAGILGEAPPTTAGLIPLDIRAVVRRASSGSATTEETQVGTPPRWIHATAVPVDDAGSVLLVLRDVTDAKQADKIRRDFVENASHELKTPAATIQAAAETIRTALDEDPSVIPRFAEQLEREAVRLARIVSDLLDLSRLETQSEEAEAVDAEPLVLEEVARFEENAARRRIELTASTEPGRVAIPPRDVRLLVANLVDNAVRYTPEGGRVDVSLSREDGALVLRVCDTGVGIPTRDLPRIFERFYRVDRARSRETGGTGLGLSIVKHIAEGAGGSVAARSELGRGSEFEVRLPPA